MLIKNIRVDQALIEGKIDYTLVFSLILFVYYVISNFLYFSYLIFMLEFFLIFYMYSKFCRNPLNGGPPCFAFCRRCKRCDVDSVIPCILLFHAFRFSSSFGWKSISDSTCRLLFVVRLSIILFCYVKIRWIAK